LRNEATGNENSILARKLVNHLNSFPSKIMETGIKSGREKTQST